jgi:hypothetical protein
MTITNHETTATFIRSELRHDRKIPAIKAVRSACPNMGLVAAKNFIDTNPTMEAIVDFLTAWAQVTSSLVLAIRALDAVLIDYKWSDEHVVSKARNALFVTLGDELAFAELRKP